MARVFVTQVPNRRDKETGALVPSVNIGPASEFGELIIMMPPTAAFFATADLVDQLKNHLEKYDYDNGDVLVALGDPAVIGTACALLGKMRDRFSMLRWDRQLGRYLKVVIKL